MQLVFYQSKNSRVRHLHFHSKSYYAISLKNSPQENNYFWRSPWSISIRVWNRRNLHAEIPSILKSVELKKQTNKQSVLRKNILPEGSQVVWIKVKKHWMKTKTNPPPSGKHAPSLLPPPKRKNTQPLPPPPNNTCKRHCGVFRFEHQNFPWCHSSDEKVDRKLAGGKPCNC